MELKVLPSECSCYLCTFMCHYPCCGTPEDVEALMDAGYAHRLMYDDFDSGESIIKPALKGFEAKRSPPETGSQKGCTFWKNEKCELHSLGLKPSGGKLAHHDASMDDMIEVTNFIADSWKSKKAVEIIARWKKIHAYN